MSSKNFKLRKLFLSLLSIAMVCCLTLSGLVACKNNSSSDDDIDYEYTYSTEDYISNPSFTNDLISKADDLYPIASVTGWDKSYHNGAVSSHVDSGAIDTTGSAWTKLYDKLKDDSDLINALTKQYKNELINDSKLSIDNESQAKDYIKANLDKFYIDNELPEGATDKHIYMFNNYPQNAAYAETTTGTAQRLKSSSKIVLEKGKYAKISVYVKTKNIVFQGDPKNAGANINLISTFNGKTMGEYRLSSIKVEDWTQYTIYVKADEKYDTSITLALGLGYGEGSNTLAKYYTQGTALFDNVTYEVLDKATDADINKIVSDDAKTRMEYNKEGNYQIPVADNQTNYLFDLTMNMPEDFPEGFFTKFDAKVDKNNLYTTSNVSTSTEGETKNITSKEIYSQSKITLDDKTDGVYKLTLDKASASLKLDCSNIKLNKQEYAIISFKIDSKLKAFGSEAITIDVIDIDGDTQTKRPAVATFEESLDEITTCNIIIKNNFENEEKDRTFNLVIVVGPTVLTNIKYANDLASGEISFYDFYYAKGSLVEDKNDNFEFYTFISNSANGTTDLYAGYDSLPSENEQAETYSLIESPSDYGTILNYPANPKDYEGVDANHVYVKQDGTNNRINTRRAILNPDNKDFTGYAGLVNSKYAEAYKTNLKGVNLDEAFKNATEDKPVQPLMIYNSNGSSYGFIGNKTTIAASSYAKITLKVKVDATATAYIYLIDVNKTDKNPLLFDEFTPYVSEDITTYGEYTSNTKLETVLKVDKNSKKDVDGWTTLSFYIATGLSSKSIRLEMWNGGRDGSTETKSTGLVLFDQVTISTSSGFVESSNCNAAFYESSSPLYASNIGEGGNTSDQLFAYQRPLSDTEIEFNAEYPDQAVSYSPNYVWAKTPTMIYAVYNTIDEVPVDPYESIEDEEETKNCNNDVDPATFWMSFSTILLIVALVLAMVMLIVKKIVRKRKANASDAKSHYKVTSRITKTNKDKQTAKKVVEDTTDNPIDEVIEEADNEEPVDEYEYSDVQDFGEETTDENSTSEEN